MPVIVTKAIATPKGLIEFRFESLRTKDDTIFAVYCSYGGVPHCFHLIKNTHSEEFEIIDRHNCPYDFHNFEQLLAEAI